MINAPTALDVRPLPVEDEYRPAERVIQEISKRYSDGYRVAVFIIGLGTAVKVLGIVLGVFLAGTGVLLPALRLGPVSMLHQQASNVALGVMITGFFAGGIAWFLLFVGGVFISAQGQMVRASLDAAVNSSPIFSLRQKVQILTATPK
jgi:hypothetical protein